MLAPWPAFLNAVGVGASSATVFVMVGFAVYVFFILFLLNRYYGANIPSKRAMVRFQTIPFWQPSTYTFIIGTHFIYPFISGEG